MSNIQEERLKLIDEIFDLFDSENIGYVEIKDSLKILASIDKKTSKKRNIFYQWQSKNEDRVTKENFIRGVKAMFTLSKDFLQTVEQVI